MVLFTILAIILAILAVFVILALAVGGSAFIIIFADVIVCALVIIWIMKRIIKRKKK